LFSNLTRYGNSITCNIPAACLVNAVTTQVDFGEGNLTDYRVGHVCAGSWLVENPAKLETWEMSQKNLIIPAFAHLCG
jgi:hypothetical protein